MDSCFSGSQEFWSNGLRVECMNSWLCIGWIGGRMKNQIAGKAEKMMVKLLGR
jgi:hypothetical protein